MTVKDDLLEDLPHVYPGLERADIERLLSLLDQSASTEATMGLSIATALRPLVPQIADRIESYGPEDVDEYVRILRGAVVPLLQEWQPESDAPTADDVADRVAALDG